MSVHELLSELLEACPSAAAAWKEEQDDWDDDRPGHFIEIAVFARHIVQSYGEDRTEEFPPFFDLLERMIVEGDEDVQGLAIVGLIEGIQNNASHQPFGYTVFEQWLRPKSRTAWREVDEAWKKIAEYGAMRRKLIEGAEMRLPEQKN